MAATRDSPKGTEQLQESDWDATLAMSIQEPEAASDAPPSTSSIPKKGGGQVTIRYDPINVKSQYADEYTREPLPLELVKSAIIDELE